MSSSLPIVTVFGATGLQGGAVVRALSATGKYQIRAPTRKPDDEKAKKLTTESKNVEVVKCELSNKDEVNAAIKGAWAVFGLTNFWDPVVLQKHELEIEHGKNIIDACDSLGVKYLVLSTLPDCVNESNGKWKVPHFDQKAVLQRYAQEKKNVKSIFFQPAAYFTNYFYYYAPSKQADGSYAISVPQSKDDVQTIFDVNDTGAIVEKLLENPDQWVNQEITAGAEKLTNQQVADAMSKAFGKKIVINEVTQEQYKGFMPAAIGEELNNMLRWFSEYGYYNDKKRDAFVAKNKLGVKMNTFEKFLAEQKFWSLPQ